MNRILMVVLEGFVVAAVFLRSGGGVEGAITIERRSAASERNSDDYPDYQLGVKYDEYPMVVPKKKTALLVDRLMVALQQAIEEEEEQLGANRIDGPPLTQSYLSPEEVRKMDLQRRGHGLAQQKGRVYWKCYFNAVSCF